MKKTKKLREKLMSLSERREGGSDYILLNLEKIQSYALYGERNNDCNNSQCGSATIQTSNFDCTNSQCNTSHQYNKGCTNDGCSGWG